MTVKSIVMWKTTDDSLVMSDVTAWRKELDPTGEESHIFNKKLPDFYSEEYRVLAQPKGLFGNEPRCVLLWSADDTKQDKLNLFVDNLDAIKGVDFHIGIIQNKDKDLTVGLEDYEPEIIESLVDIEDPVAWADEYFTEFYNAELSKDAYSYLEIVAATDYALVGQVVGSFQKKLEDLNIDPDDEPYIIDKEEISDTISRIGEIDFFDFSNAINNGDVATAADLAIRFDPRSLPGIMSSIKNRLYISSQKYAGVSIPEMMESFRNVPAELEEIEIRKEKLDRKGKTYSESDFDKVVKYKISEKQARYFYNTVPRYTNEEVGKIYSTIAAIDRDVKNHRLNKYSVLQFATTVSLINQRALHRAQKRSYK